MAYSSGQASFKVAYELSPITLVGGVASSVPGGALSILSILQAGSFGGLLGSANVGLDDFLGNFYPINGSTLIDNQIGSYPFANLQIAANSIIVQPLACSMLMRVPVRDEGGYSLKTSAMTSLQNTLANHTQQGGTFSVATPSFFYTNLILLKLQDVSGGETLQAQVSWRFDFIKPLLTLDQAAQVQNAMMSQLTNGVQTVGDGTGLGVNTGTSANVTSPAVSPASGATASSSVGSYNFGQSVQAGPSTGSFGLSGVVSN